MIDCIVCLCWSEIEKEQMMVKKSRTPSIDLKAFPFYLHMFHTLFLYINNILKFDVLETKNFLIFSAFN